MRPLEYMESLGWIGPDVWYAHGIHFNGEELRRLAETGTGVAHCPISNMKLSSGVCRVPEMLELGVPVGLAVDGSASNDGSNLLEELRVAYLLHRLQSSEKAPSGYDVLKIATVGSAKILGRDDIGSLEVGEGRRPVRHRHPPSGAGGGGSGPQIPVGDRGLERPGGLHRGQRQGHGPQRKTGESGRGKSRPGGRRAGAGLLVPLRPACPILR